jgi:hypothetical protein
MYASPVFELTIVGVAEPNVPNRERIVFRPTQTMVLTDFAVLVGVRANDGTLIPLWDHFYWFGSYTVSAPSWICLYTGKGQASHVTHPETGELIHNFYWNRDKTIFYAPTVHPLLIRIGGLLVGSLLQEPRPKLISPPS